MAAATTGFAAALMGTRASIASSARVSMLIVVSMANAELTLGRALSAYAPTAGQRWGMTLRQPATPLPTLASFQFSKSAAAKENAQMGSATATRVTVEGAVSTIRATPFGVVSMASVGWIAA